MVKAIRNFITVSKEINDARKLAYIDAFNTRSVTRDMVNSEGYIIEENTLLLRRNNIMIAGVMEMYFPMCGIPGMPGEKFPYIVVDSLYYQLSDDAKEFIIMHELGHYYDTKKVYGRDIHNEFTADEYALSKLGYKRCIKSLKEIKKLLVLIGDTKEIKKRINNLAKKNNCK